MAALQIRNKPDNSRKVLFRCGCSKIQMMWALVPAEGFRHAPATDCNAQKRCPQLPGRFGTEVRSGEDRSPIVLVPQAGMSQNVPKCPRFQKIVICSRGPARLAGPTRVSANVRAGKRSFRLASRMPNEGRATIFNNFQHKTKEVSRPRWPGAIGFGMKGRQESLLLAGTL